MATPAATAAGSTPLALVVCVGMAELRDAGVYPLDRIVLFYGATPLRKRSGQIKVDNCQPPTRVTSVSEGPRHGDPRLCTAKRTNGEPCQNWKLKGLNVCRFHGGGSPQARAAAKRRLALAEARKLLGIPEDIEPTEALLHAVRVSAGDMLALAAVVNDDPKFVAPYERAVERVAKISKAALDAGVAERRVQMAEAQASEMMQVLQAGLDAAKLSPEQQAAAKLAMVNEIHRLEGRKQKATELLAGES